MSVHFPLSSFSGPTTLHSVRLQDQQRNASLEPGTVLIPLIEMAVSGRAGCQDAECKKAGIKIDKDEVSQLSKTYPKSSKQRKQMRSLAFGGDVICISEVLMG